MCVMTRNELQLESLSATIIDFPFQPFEGSGMRWNKQDEVWRYANSLLKDVFEAATVVVL